MIEGIYTIRKPRNRSEKREWKREIKKANRLIVEIESEFEYSIFNAPNEIKYADLYNYFLKKWNDLVDLFFEKAIRFTYIIFDVKHFSKKYKAVI